jgi:aspartate 1-decarboxylase
MNFAQFTPEEAVGHRPRVILVNEKNEVLSTEKVIPEYRDSTR